MTARLCACGAPTPSSRHRLCLACVEAHAQARRAAQGRRYRERHHDEILARQAAYRDRRRADQATDARSHRA